jgi:hypothetical protein
MVYLERISAVEPIAEASGRMDSRFSEVSREWLMPRQAGAG